MEWSRERRRECGKHGPPTENRPAVTSAVTAAVPAGISTSDSISSERLSTSAANSVPPSGTGTPPPPRADSCREQHPPAGCAESEPSA